MDFLAQIGVGLVVLLILYIIIKSNKSLEKAYMQSQQIQESSIRKEEREEEKGKKSQKLERSSPTVASDFVLNQERHREMEFCIWTVDAGGRLEEKIEVSSYPFTIGRAEDNDFVIPDNSVSSHHAQIIKEGETVLLEDTNSLNKIFVNGRQVLEVELRDGLCVFLGNTELYVEHR